MLCVDDDTYDREVMQASGLVLVAYLLMSQESSSKVLAMLRELEPQHASIAKFTALDVERSTKTVDKARIFVAPMIGFYFAGKERHLLFHPIEREMITATLRSLSPN